MRIAIHILAHVLTFVLTVGACIWLGLLTPSPRVMEVNSSLLLQRFSQNQPTLSEQQTARQVQRYLNVMEQVLARVAVEQGVVVVDADLAIAGAQDITDVAYGRAMSIMASEGGS